jgi:cob(I)alamin adenosyltransferase
MPKVYTRTGDDGTTGLLYGKRVRKDHPSIEANGAVDEAQAVLGVARAETERGSELDTLLVGIERNLWVVMAEIATPSEDRHKLQAGKSLVTEEMVSELEVQIDGFKERNEVPADFVVPGQDRTSALLDQARTVVRRAERLVISARLTTSEEKAETDEKIAIADDTVSDDTVSFVAPYLNRLSDLIWTVARWQEGAHELARQSGKPRSGGRSTSGGS